MTSLQTFGIVWTIFWFVHIVSKLVSKANSNVSEIYNNHQEISVFWLTPLDKRYIHTSDKIFWTPIQVLHVQINLNLIGYIVKRLISIYEHCTSGHTRPSRDISPLFHYCTWFLCVLGAIKILQKWTCHIRHCINWERTIISHTSASNTYCPYNLLHLY